MKFTSSAKPTDPMDTAEFSWRQLTADAVLWCCWLGLFTVFRGLMLWIFRSEISPDTSAREFLRCFSAGLHFDVSIATYLTLPSLVLTGAGFVRSLGGWHERIRRAVILLGVPTCVIVLATDIGYFAEYNDQFNHWIFGLVYDDRQAIWGTIRKSYPLGFIGLGAMLAAGAGIWVIGKLCRVISSCIRIPRRVPIGYFRIIMPNLILGLAVMGARGTLGPRPVQLRDAATTGNQFLNKLVLNPFSALKYAIFQHRLLQSSAGLQNFLPDGNIAGAAHALFPQVESATNLDHCLERVVRRSPGTPPSDIFLVVMEGYDAWALQSRYAELHLTDRLAALGREGIQSKGFLSASTGTMPTLATLITGLPEVGIIVNYQPSVRGGLPMSTASIFKRLGYRTRFFYGGYLSWQRLGDFCREQGFEEVYGGDQMSAQLTGKEWGVDDEDLFRFVLDRTNSGPTFNVIMTTSYHPPFAVDIKAKGFPERALANTKLGQSLNKDQLNIYGHLWYSDHCLGEFVAAAERRLARPLFAITGDHYSRRYPPGLRPTIFERKAVPCVFYGQKALAGVVRSDALAGSHLDLVPTLVHLTAPEGFRYHSFGRDMLDSTQAQFGYGVGAVVTPGFILDVEYPQQPEDLAGRPLAVDDEIAAGELRYWQLHALGWWRALKGAGF